MPPAWLGTHLDLAVGALVDIKLEWAKEPAACVIVASEGYPESVVKDREIRRAPESETGLSVFHGGTTMKDGKLVTAGGRVFAVTAVGATLPQALNRAYDAVNLVDFDGRHFRKDIGSSALKKIGAA